MCWPNSFRNPVLLAQEAATIDVLSGGRLELGIGAGWLRTDYDALGIPFPPPGVRVDRLAEAIPLIKRLLGTEAVTHTGAHYQVQDLDLMPKPLQRPHPPLFVGGAGRRMLSLAAREADIVSLDAASTVRTKDLASRTPDATARQVEWVRQAAGDRFAELELHVQSITSRSRPPAKRCGGIIATCVISPLPSPATVRGNRGGRLASPSALIGTSRRQSRSPLERRARYGVSYITMYADQIDAFAPVASPPSPAPDRLTQTFTQTFGGGIASHPTPRSVIRGFEPSAPAGAGFIGSWRAGGSLRWHLQPPCARPLPAAQARDGVGPTATRALTGRSRLQH